MSIEEIINGLDSIAQEKQAQNAGLPDGWPLDTGWLDDETALREAIAMLKTHPDAQPNEPLTLEELREMDGEPVWVKSKHFTGWGICCKPNFTVFGIVRNSQCDIAFYAADGHVYFAWTSNGYNERLGAKIYRRPPKED